jgi:hypothetical protein
MSLWMRAALVWGALLVVMFGNGAFRALVLQPRLGEQVARQVSSVLGMGVIFAAAGVLVRWHAGAESPRAWLAAGVLWCALTLAFEILFGRYVSGMSWDALLADYDVTSGRLWPLVVASTIVAPWLGALVSGRAR